MKTVVLWLALVALFGWTAAPNAEGASERGTASAGFATPSGNIKCLLEGNVLRCTVVSGLKPAPLPISCELDQIPGLQLGRTGRARTYVSCQGGVDGPMAVRGPSLPYGSSWRGGGITCISRSLGLTCRNASGNGFFLSRDGWRPLASGAPATMGSAPSVYFYESGFRVKPTTMFNFAGTGWLSASKLRWITWGAKTAEAIGQLLEQDCDPSCAAGGYKPPYPATFRLSAPRKCKGKSVYSILTVTARTWAPKPRSFQLSNLAGYACGW